MKRFLKLTLQTFAFVIGVILIVLLRRFLEIKTGCELYWLFYIIGGFWGIFIGTLMVSTYYKNK
jgi:hypothetical protein